MNREVIVNAKQALVNRGEREVRYSVIIVRSAVRLMNGTSGKLSKEQQSEVARQISS
jgi:hypothetical protein